MSKNIKNEDYNLKTDAVNDLVSVLRNQENPEKSSGKEEKIKGPYNPYKVDRLSKVPTVIKALFVKFWVAGMICYFFFWGLSGLFNNTLDLLVFTGICLGFVNDVLVNTAFLYFESDKKEYHRYMLVPVSCKKMWTLLINIPYGILEVLTISLIYQFINTSAIKIWDLPEVTVFLGVEPILYGIFFVIVDMFYISIKNLFVRILNDAKEKVKKQFK